MKKISLVLALMAGLSSSISAQAAQTLTGKVTSIVTQDGWPGSVDPNGSGVYYTFVKVTPTTTAGTLSACAAGKAGWFAVPSDAGDAGSVSVGLLQAAYIGAKTVTITGYSTGVATNDCWWGHEKALRITLQ